MFFGGYFICLLQLLCGENFHVLKCFMQVTILVENNQGIPSLASSDYNTFATKLFITNEKYSS